MTEIYNPSSKMLGKFGRYDGTIEFYGRIRSVVSKNSIVLDYGAGRGGWYTDMLSSYAKSIRTLKPDVLRVIGYDVDIAVLENPSTHENLFSGDGAIPLEKDSVDVIIADYVLEHVTDANFFYSEIYRVLKPGGFFCARTPTAFNYVSLGARLIKNTKHSALLKYLQPSRNKIDVFPTAYKLNTTTAIRSLWVAKAWDDYSYIYSAEPQYFFGSHIVFVAMELLHKLLPEIATGNLFLFLQKRGSVE